MKTPHKKEPRPWWSSFPVIFLAGVLVVLIAISLGKLIKKSVETRQVRDQYAQKLEELQKQEEDLFQNLEYLDTERGMEEAIRERYPVTREGEELVIIVDAPSEEAAEEEVAKQNFFQRLFD